MDRERTSAAPFGIRPASRIGSCSGNKLCGDLISSVAGLQAAATKSHYRLSRAAFDPCALDFRRREILSTTAFPGSRRRGKSVVCRVSVTASNALQSLSSNVDYILVGRFLGPTQLGFYSMAWDLLRFITNRLSKVAGRVTLPAFCQLQNSNEKLARAYQIFIGYMGRIVLPAMACIAVAASRY